MKKTYAVLDLETGGFSGKKNGLCEIGIAVLNDEYKVVAIFSTLIRPYKRLDGSGDMVSYKEDAMAVNKIRLDDLENCHVTLDDALSMVLFLISTYNVTDIVAHNAPFDFGFIEKIVEEDDYLPFKPIIERNKICSKSLAKQKYGELPSHSLENMCKHLDIVNTAPHTATGDVLATVELLKHLHGAN